MDTYESVLEHASSKMNFTIVTDIYMSPSNLNLGIWKTVGYNNNILASNMEMKIALSRNINKNELYHQKTQSPGTTSKTHLVKGPDGK